MSAHSSARWEAPPNRGGWGRWVVAARLLRSKPGRWAVVGEYSTLSSAGTTTARLRRKPEFAAVDSGHYEFRSAGLKVYGRFVGVAK